jgi:hypothetical protein
MKSLDANSCLSMCAFDARRRSRRTECVRIAVPLKQFKAAAGRYCLPCARFTRVGEPFSATAAQEIVRVSLFQSD